MQFLHTDHPWSQGKNICGQMAMDGHLSATEQDANWRDPNIFAVYWQRSCSASIPTSM